MNNIDINKMVLLGDRILVKTIKQNIISGFIVPESNREKPTYGTVIAIGNGKLPDGKVLEMDIKIGDEIMFQKWANGQEINQDDNNYMILKYSDIIGLIK